MEGEGNLIPAANFDDVGLRIDIPMRVDQRDPGDFSCEDNPGVFELIRVVGAIKLVDTSVEPEAVLRQFSPSALLTVEYTPDDYEQANGHLKLGYCAGKGWGWQPIHHFKLIPDDPKNPGAGGVGQAIIREWEDPAVGWGH